MMVYSMMELMVIPFNWINTLLALLLLLLSIMLCKQLRHRGQLLQRAKRRPSEILQAAREGVFQSRPPETFTEKTFLYCIWAARQATELSSLKGMIEQQLLKVDQQMCKSRALIGALVWMLPLIGLLVVVEAVMLLIGLSGGAALTLGSTVTQLTIETGRFAMLLPLLVLVLSVALALSAGCMVKVYDRQAAQIRLELEQVMHFVCARSRARLQKRLPAPQSVPSMTANLLPFRSQPLSASDPIQGYKKSKESR